MKILIKNIAEIYSSKKQTKKNQFILIKDQLIKKIASMDQVDETDDYDYLIDAQGKIVVPGFVNTHTHSAMTLLRGYADDMPLNSWLEKKIWPFESETSRQDIYWGALLAAVEMIKTGTTTFSDMYFSMDLIAKVVENSGLRSVLATGLIEEKDGKKGLEAAYNFANEYNNTVDGRIKTMLAPHAPYTCSKNYLIKIKKLAQKNNLPIHIHLSESKKELKDFNDQYGVSPIKFLNNINFFDNHILAAHCVHLEAGDLEILKEKNVHIAHNPKSNAKLANGIAAVSKYLKNDINVGLGTDGVSSNNALDMLEEARMASYLQKVKTGDPTVMDVNQILDLITVNGAKALGYKNIAEIKEGYKADLLLIDINRDSFFIPHHNNLSNLFYAANSSSVDTVVIDGKVVMENRELKTLDQEKIYYEVEKRALKIAKKINN